MMPLNWKLFVAALIFISLAREVISTQYGSLCDSVGVVVDLVDDKC